MDFQLNPIYLFYPNLIGYLRIVFALFSFAAMPTRPVAASIWYFLSAFLDAFDGYLARKYNQSLNDFLILKNFVSAGILFWCFFLV